MGFLKIILVLLLIYYGFKILAKWYGPKLINYAAKKTEEKFKERFNNATQQQSNEQNVGDVTIKTKSSNKKSSNNTVGEYIDFEEVD